MSQPLFIYPTYSAPTITATDTHSGSAATNVQYGTEDTYWAPADTTGNKDLTFDLGAATTFDAVAILGASLDGVTMEVRASTDNFVASDVQISAGAALSGDVAAWRAVTSSSYRYWRVRFSGMGSAFRVYHLALQDSTLLPYPESDWDDRTLTTTGDHLVSQGGYYVGAAKQRTMREMSIRFGSVTDVDALTDWATYCVQGMAGFFFVPDSAETTVYFGWADPSFSAPLDRAMYQVSPIKFTTRA